MGINRQDFLQRNRVTLEDPIAFAFLNNSPQKDALVDLTRSLVKFLGESRILQMIDECDKDPRQFEFVMSTLTKIAPLLANEEGKEKLNLLFNKGFTLIEIASMWMVVQFHPESFVQLSKTLLHEDTVEPKKNLISLLSNREKILTKEIAGLNDFKRYVWGDQINEHTYYIDAALKVFGYGPQRIAELWKFCNRNISKFEQELEILNIVSLQLDALALKQLRETHPELPDFLVILHQYHVMYKKISKALSFPIINSFVNELLLSQTLDMVQILTLWRITKRDPLKFGAELQECASKEPADRAIRIKDLQADYENEITDATSFAQHIWDMKDTNFARHIELLIATSSRPEFSLKLLISLWQKTSDPTIFSKQLLQINDAYNPLETFNFLLKEPISQEQSESKETVQSLSLKKSLKQYFKTSALTLGVISAEEKVDALDLESLLDAQFADLQNVLGDTLQSAWFLSLQEASTPQLEASSQEYAAVVYLLQLADDISSIATEPELYAEALQAIDSAPSATSFRTQLHEIIKKKNAEQKQARKELRAHQEDLKLAVFPEIEGIADLACPPIDWESDETWETLKKASKENQYVQVFDTTEREFQLQSGEKVSLKYQTARIPLDVLAMKFGSNQLDIVRYWQWFENNFGTDVPTITVARRLSETPVSVGEPLGTVRITAGWTGDSEKMSFLYSPTFNHPTLAEMLLLRHGAVITYPSAQFSGALTSDRLSDSAPPEIRSKILKAFADRTGVPYEIVGESEVLKRMFNSYAAAEMYTTMDRIIGGTEFAIGHSRSGDAVLMESAADVLLNCLALMPASHHSGTVSELFWEDYRVAIEKLEPEMQGQVRKVLNNILLLTMAGNFRALEFLVQTGNTIPLFNKAKLPYRLGALITRLFTFDHSLGNSSGQIETWHKATIGESDWRAVAYAIGLLAVGNRAGLPLDEMELMRNLPFVVLGKKDKLSVFASVDRFLGDALNATIASYAPWIAGDSEEILKDVKERIMLVLEDVGHYAFVGENMETIIQSWWKYLDATQLRETSGPYLDVAKLVADIHQPVWFIVTTENASATAGSLEDQLKNYNTMPESASRSFAFVVTPLSLLKLRRALKVCGSTESVEDLWSQKKELLNGAGYQFLRMSVD
ncbi:MAG: hypothetical protein WAU07_04640 [Microgenomates group bacterium]